MHASNFRLSGIQVVVLATICNGCQHPMGVVRVLGRNSHSFQLSSVQSSMVVARANPVYGVVMRGRYGGSAAHALFVARLVGILAKVTRRAFTGQVVYLNGRGHRS